MIQDLVIGLWAVPEFDREMNTNTINSESHRDSKSPSGGTITTDRCLWGGYD